MSQVYDSFGVPQGFQAAGTYSGLCSSRVKLDVAMIVSRRDCSIVTDTQQGMTARSGKVLVLHMGRLFLTGSAASRFQRKSVRLSAPVSMKRRLQSLSSPAVPRASISVRLS